MRKASLKFLEDLCNAPGVPGFEREAVALARLTALALLTIALARRTGLEEKQEKALVAQLAELPALIEQVLALDASIETLAEHFVDKHRRTQARSARARRRGHAGRHGRAR